MKLTEHDKKMIELIKLEKPKIEEWNKLTKEEQDKRFFACWCKKHE